MSTEDLDTRLQAAGERWRAANATVADLDLGPLAITGGAVDVPVTPVPEVASRRRRRMPVVLASGVGIAAAVAATIVALQLGGSTHPPRPPQPAAGTVALVGVDWRLVTIAGVAATSLAVSAPLMIDKTGQLTGTDGCNGLGAPATITGDTITLGAVATTQVACIDRKPGFAAQVARLDAVLSGSVQWSVQGDQLTLSKDGKAALVYRAAPARSTDPKALIGIDWQLTSIAGAGPNATASTPSAPASLHFDATGKVGGNDGCNARYGPVTITSGRLRFGHLGTTYVGCGPNVASQVSSITAMLGGEVSWSIKDGQLTLSKAGVGTLTYRQTS